MKAIFRGYLKKSRLPKENPFKIFTGRSKGKTTDKELKHLLLQCRGRMVEEISDFVFFVAKTQNESRLQNEMTTNQIDTATNVKTQLQEQIKEKDELLEVVARRVNYLVSKINNEERLNPYSVVLENI